MQKAISPSSLLFRFSANCSRQPGASEGRRYFQDYVEYNTLLLAFIFACSSSISFRGSDSKNALCLNSRERDWLVWRLQVSPSSQGSSDSHSA